MKAERMIVTEPVDAAVLHVMWVALLEWFGALGHKTINAQEARIWGCIDARWCANLGWLERDAARHCFTPAGELAAELNHLGPSVQCTPTPGATGAVNEVAPAASPKTNGTATAPAVPILETCCQHPAGSSGSAGRMPAARLPRADQLVEIARMRECVALLAEEIEAGWQQVIQAQQAEGWPDFDKIQDATHALHRTTRDLDNLTHEMVMKLRWRPAK